MKTYKTKNGNTWNPRDNLFDRFVYKRFYSYNFDINSYMNLYNQTRTTPFLANNLQKKI